MTCAARRREILARSRSRRRLRKIAVDANTARSMRRLYNGGKHSEREWLTHRTVRCVRGRDEMNVISTMTKIYREPTVFEPRAYLRSTKPPSTKPQTEPSSSSIF